MADDPQGPRLDRVNLAGARIHAGDFTGARFHGVGMRGAVMRGVDLVDAAIHGDFDGLTINGVSVGDFVNAELDRRHPERATMRPDDADGFRQAWDVLERLWDETVHRARGLDPELLHASVDDEWSFIETLRHLLFATDAWVSRAVLGDPVPWHPLDLPWDEMPDTPPVPRDRDVRPTLDEVLRLRRDRMATVGEVIGDLTDESLNKHTPPVDGPGWPAPGSYPVRECLQCVLTEEWEHRLFAERDLAALADRGAVAGST